MTIPPVSERAKRPCRTCFFTEFCIADFISDDCKYHFSLKEIKELIEEHNDLQTAPEKGFYKERVVVVTAGMHCPCVDPDYVWTPEDPVLKCSHPDYTDADHVCSLDGRSIPSCCPLPVATRDQFNQAFPDSSFVEINKISNAISKEANHD